MKRHILTYLVILTTELFSQTYKGTSAKKDYSCNLIIHKDSSIYFNYAQKDNGVFADFNGRIRKINDTLFSLSCTSFFTQYSIRNFSVPDLQISLDTLKDNPDRPKFAKVKYPSGFDTTYYFNQKNKLDGTVGCSTYVFKHYKKFDSPLINTIRVDVGYTNILSKAPIIFYAGEETALNFSTVTKIEFFVTIKNNIVKSVINRIPQTGEIILRKTSN